ncbi:MAG: flagellar biosynthetic protein FliR [Deltaproteobacteria bacterium]|nr:flagellar biosynthetic protein FliR [Deltaproteobacteria bacterium]
MTLPLVTAALADLLRPHILAVALIAARIVPATLLCPIFGGQAAPMTVRVALCLVLSLHAHLAGDVSPTLENLGAMEIMGAFVRELLCGTVVGFVAALPFDAARIGGRLLDTLRGANAESSLPATGSREAATGDLLYQLLCAVVFAGPLYRVLATSILMSFRAAPLGLPGEMATDALVQVALLQATGALAAGLAIGAPAAAVSLIVDVGLAMAGRIAPNLSIRDIGAPAKLTLGAAAILVSLGAVAQRLLSEVAGAADAIGASARVLGGGS